MWKYDKNAFSSISPDLLCYRADPACEGPPTHHQSNRRSNTSPKCVYPSPGEWAPCVWHHWQSYQGECDTKLAQKRWLWNHWSFLQLCDDGGTDTVGPAVVLTATVTFVLRLVLVLRIARILLQTSTRHSGRLSNADKNDKITKDEKNKWRWELFLKDGQVCWAFQFNNLCHRKNVLEPGLNSYVTHITKYKPVFITRRSNWSYDRSKFGWIGSQAQQFREILQRGEIDWSVN